MKGITTLTSTYKEGKREKESIALSSNTRDR